MGSNGWKLYAVDAVNILFRSYYAIAPMSNPKGESTNALFGFIRTMYKLIKDFAPEYVVAIFDGPENKRERTALYKEYKSHRKGMPEDLFPQWEYARTFCDLAGIPSLAIEGVEADDTMGSIAVWAEQQGALVFLCSTDKDLSQLVNDKVHIINPYKDHLVIDPAYVQGHYGVPPAQFVDFLAITGDPSDNIPGIEGLGPKAASVLLQEFGSLESIFSHLDSIPEKRRALLTKGKELAYLSKELARIRTDVDFPKEKSFFQCKSPDIEALKAFYRDMQFLSLLKDLGNEPAKPSAKTSHMLNDASSLIALVEKLSKEKEVCIDVQMTGEHFMRAEIVGIGLGVHGGNSWYCPLNGPLDSQALSLLQPLLENPNIGFIGHNVKCDLHALLNAGIRVTNIAFDTELASYLLAPNRQKHDLDVLILEQFGKVKTSIEHLLGKGKECVSLKDIPSERLMEISCENVSDKLALKTHFEAALRAENLTNLFSQIELPLIFVLLHMERHGIFVDVAALQAQGALLAKEREELEEEIYAMAQERFNLNSPKQLSYILFEKLCLKPPKKTTTGYSTSADVLEALQKEAPIVEHILAYRTLTKLLTTYIEALPKAISPDTGRIHCTFQQSVAATGRLTSQDPNLQNIPIRSVEGKKVREAFRPERPGDVYISADYSQIELRLLAHFSEDPVLMKAFQEEEDIHRYTASLVFNIPLDQVTSEMRSIAKAVNFGIIYGQQAFGLSKTLGISLHEATSFIRTYFQRYAKVKEFLHHCITLTQKTKKATTLLGRQRPIPEIDSTNAFLRGQAERLAVNTPLQGSQADLIKLAMLEMDRYLEEDPARGMMVLQVHDQLLMESPKKVSHTVGKRVKEIMESAVTLKVPLVAHVSIGKNWSEC